MATPSLRRTEVQSTEERERNCLWATNKQTILCATRSVLLHAMHYPCCLEASGFERICCGDIKSQSINCDYGTEHAVQCEQSNGTAMSAVLNVLSLQRYYYYVLVPRHRHSRSVECVKELRGRRTDRSPIDEIVILFPFQFESSKPKNRKVFSNIYFYVKSLPFIAAQPLLHAVARFFNIFLFTWHFDIECIRMQKVRQATLTLTHSNQFESSLVSDNNTTMLCHTVTCLSTIVVFISLLRIFERIFCACELHWISGITCCHQFTHRIYWFVHH